jgi:cysteinyl-tRNA synthetase
MRPFFNIGIRSLPFKSLVLPQHTPRTFSRAAIMAPITVHNSLQPGPPVPFVPKEEGKVSWYACGPTVYDLSHLGHARSYVSTDIVRRIMLHYFGLQVNFVMNMTDVDDKVRRSCKLSEVLLNSHRADYY